MPARRGPLTPADAIRTAKAMAEIYGAAADQLLVVVARQVARGVHQSTAASQLAQLRELRERAERIVAAAQAAAGPEAVRLVEQAYAGGLRDSLAAINQRSVAAIARSLAPNLDRAGPQMLRWADDAYRAAVAEAAPLAVAGAVTVDQAAAAAVDRLALQGVTGFRDSSGALWRVESYAEMATRTAVQRAHLEGTLDRITGHGDDLVIVSDSPAECARCRPFEGQVFSVSGTSTEFPPLDDAISRGLFHPNCTHSVSKYVVGLTRKRTGTANPQADRDRQRLRELERRVRESRRRVHALEQMRDPGRLDEQRRLLRARQDALRAHLRSAGLEHKAARAAQRTGRRWSGVA